MQPSRLTGMRTRPSVDPSATNDSSLSVRLALQFAGGFKQSNDRTRSAVAPGSVPPSLENLHYSVSRAREAPRFAFAMEGCRPGA